jgi:hypothetical protein
MSMTPIKLHGWPCWTSGARLWRSAGMTGLAFFFIKGLLWMLLPLAWYAMK